MPATLKFTAHAIKDLVALDKSAAMRILGKIEQFAAGAEPLKNAKPLLGRLAGLYRFRIGDYRAIFERHQNGSLTILLILRIKHRKDVYE